MIISFETKKLQSICCERKKLIDFFDNNTEPLNAFKALYKELEIAKNLQDIDLIRVVKRDNQIIKINYFNDRIINFEIAFDKKAETFSEITRLKLTHIS